MLVHGPGDVQGEPYSLDDEFRHVILHLYELDDAGRRIVRRGFLSRPKGRAKTELAGALSAAELAGPVRFGGWDSRRQPVGVPVRGAQVVAYATEEGQAGTTYSTAAYMLGEGAAADAYPLDVGLSRTYLRGGGVMLAETSGAVSAEGGRTTFAVFDETWAWVTRQLRELQATVLRNLGKRALAEPWSLETSAMYRPGENSVAEVLHRHVERLAEEGVADLSLYVDHRQAPPVELDDDEGLEAALRIVYGPAAQWLDLVRIMAEIRDPHADETEARRFWLNQPARAAEAWLEDLDGFRALAVEHELEAGTPVALGFDGSLSDDATALVGCTLGRDEPPHLFVVGVWEAPEEPAARAAWVVDREAVNTAVADAFDQLDVVLFYGDPAYWTPELAAWAGTFGADVVREYPTSRDYRMGPATAALHTAIVTGELTHDGDGALVRHVGNAHQRRTRYGAVLRKDRPSSARKIDAASASVIAFAARNDALAGNLDRRRRRRRRHGERRSARLVTF
jgi:phage terminase large subunit-like protein